jgi:hypothetical protein
MESSVAIGRRVSNGKSVNVTSPRGKEVVHKPFFISKDVSGSSPSIELRQVWTHLLFAFRFSQFASFLTLQDLVQGHFSARGAMSVFQASYARDTGLLPCLCDVTRFTLTVTLEAAV